MLALLPLQGACLQVAPSSEPTDRAEFMDKEMRKMMRKHHLPAFAVSIVEDQNILFQDARGYIDLEKKIPASGHSVFKWYSVSKMFTALEIFREVEEGFIDLDAPLVTYLPDFSIQSRFPEAGKVTVRNILAHRSGLPRNGCISCPPDKHDPYSLEKFEKTTEECYMAFPVGFRYHYSNLGYNLLGRIVEETRDMGFASYMKSHLLQDLGMESSAFFSGDLTDPGAVAQGYEYFKRRHYPMDQSDIRNVPSGNLYSTIEDLSSFLKVFLNHEVFATEHTLQQMFVDHYSTPEDPETMGLGWKTLKMDGKDLMIWHDGGPDDGMGALVAFLPDQKLGIAMVANSTSLSSDKSIPWAMEIFTHLKKEKSNQSASKAQKSQRVIAGEGFLQDFEGTYIAWGMPMVLEARRNKLKGKIGGFSLDLIPVSKTEFRVSQWMDRVGLTKIISPPIAFDKLRIHFPGTDPIDAEYLIINLNRISYEICPRYPDQPGPGELWESLQGDYHLAGRLPGNKAGNDWGSEYTLRLEENVLKLSGVFGPILPLDHRFIRIISGPFAGETMEYLPGNGHIVHQNAVFIPHP
jgi:CubicO group peptidase (beta-lactamase class C family)